MSEQNIFQDLDNISENLFKKFVTKTFGLMGVGLLVSALVAYLTFNDILNDGFIANLVFGNQFGFYVLFFGQLGLALFFGFMLYKMNPMIAYILFFVYCTFTGITFSVLPLAYGIYNVFYAFIFTAVLFICCAIIGHTTSIDISKFSGLLIGGLFTLVIISVVSMFINLDGISLIVCYGGVIIFLGITAWDTQKLKAYYEMYSGDEEMLSRLSVYGAFQLYLDFINLFIYILRIIGRRGKK
ncbi:MAG: Bax inhibitor-1/YccA family protein [Erysipelotrichaceae bacterium]|nr:Bax inhibitor-1/YccA family protein [Erysipelotrichaceae bacterium]